MLRDLLDAEQETARKVDRAINGKHQDGQKNRMNGA